MKKPSFLKPGKRRSAETPEQRFLRITIWTFVAMFFVLSSTAGVAFLLSLRGPEETMVPNVVGDELVDGLLELQGRGLFPLIQLRFHSDPTLRGRIVNQNPAAGAVVRVGRRVTLTVSQGAIIEDVEDYRGMSLQELQSELQALSSGSTRVLFMGSISHVFDDAPAGTVIAQDPPAGSQLLGSTPLDVVVSRGPDIEIIALPTYLGLDWREAMQVLVRDNVPFVFRLEEDRTPGRGGVVVAQNPEPGNEVEMGTPVHLAIRNEPNPERGMRFNVFDRTLPTYAVSVELSAVAVDPEGETRTLFAMNHPGGRIAFPYELEIGSVIILYRFDTEVLRFPILDPTQQFED